MKGGVNDSIRALPPILRALEGISECVWAQGMYCTHFPTGNFSDVFCQLMIIHWKFRPVRDPVYNWSRSQKKRIVGLIKMVWA